MLSGTEEILEETSFLFTPPTKLDQSALSIHSRVWHTKAMPIVKVPAFKMLLLSTMFSLVTFVAVTRLNRAYVIPVQKHGSFAALDLL